jgi:cell wall-associated NlpC family hydrolase
VSPADASPIGDKQAEAAKLQSQIEAQGERIGSLAEQYNQAVLKAQQADAAAAKAKVDLAKSGERLAAARTRMATQAVSAYVHGGQVSTLSQLARSDGRDLAVRTQYLSAATKQEHAAADEFRQAGQDLTLVQSKLAGAQQSSRAAMAAADAARRDAAAAESKLQAALRRVNGDLASLVAAEESRRSAASAQRAQAAQAAARARSGSSPRASRSSGPPPGSAPAPSSGAAAAVEFAKAQVGKPYRYGGAGPDSYDCSGLTMRSWERGGVRLSHSSQAQWREVTHVALDDRQPGDLFFFTSDLHHVTIYIGNDTMVEASQTGRPLRYASIWRSDFRGVGRPG